VAVRCEDRHGVADVKFGGDRDVACEAALDEFDTGGAGLDQVGRVGAAGEAGPGGFGFR
jgi:hypothetical protein